VTQRRGGVGPLRGERHHCLQLVSQAIERPGAQRLVRARVDLRKPGIELVLEVQLVGEGAPALEVRLRIALQALDGALGLRAGRLAEPPPDSELAAEGGEGLRRSAVVAVDARLAVPDQRPRQPAQPLKTTGDPGQQVLGPRRKDQRARARARE
jgi:hypothetical protein